jgi:8-oxo-dGTP pyrophosphatase MutT (NUDIX family)
MGGGMTMQLLRVLDAGNYDASASKFVRSAVRAIIFKNGKLALVQSKKIGEYKFPGGGVEAGETYLAALIREVKEETGLTVIPSSVHEYGMTREIRADAIGGGIFEQNSYYYLCETEETVSGINLDAYEEEYGYNLKFVTVDEAISINACLLDHVDAPWVNRELSVLRHIKNNLL